MGGPSLAPGSANEFPVVKFMMPNGKTQEHIVTPESWSIEQSGKVVAKRDQLPLKLAWVRHF